MTVARRRFAHQVACIAQKRYRYGVGTTCTNLAEKTRQSKREFNFTAEY